MTREEFSKKLKDGNYSNEFKKFLEEKTIEYLEGKLPVLKGQYKCEIDGTIGVIKRNEIY